MSLFRGLAREILFSSSDSVVNMVVNRFVSWAACTAADLSRRLLKPWAKVGSRRFLIVPSSQLTSPPMYISRSMLCWSLAKSTDSSWSHDLTTIFVVVGVPACSSLSRSVERRSLGED